MFANITAVTASHAQGRPDHPALIRGPETITYRELERRVAQAAGGLRAIGLERSAIIGLSMPDTIEHLVRMLALLRIGCVVMPMDVRWTDTERDRVLQHFDAAAIVSAETTLPTASPIASWETEPASPAFLSLTSGTTGIPKGALLTHGLYLTRLICEAITLRTSPDDLNLCATPIQFGAGRNITLTNLFMGATVALFPPPYEPAELVAEVKRVGANTMYLVPTLIRRLLPLAPPAGRLFENFRMLMCGGAIIHPDEWAAARRRIAANLLNIYATSEAGCISLLPPEADARYADSVGRAAFMTELEVVDTDDWPLPRGEVGHIRYRSPQVPAGYHSAPEETRAAFRGGWYYPGDLGKLDAEGYLYIVGRAKDMIIRGGVNVYPAEVESVLLAHPQVAEAAVVAWPSREFGEEVAAFVLAHAPIEEHALLALCRERLARYKVPRKVFFVDEFPRTPAGKIVKPELAARLARIE